MTAEGYESLGGIKNHMFYFNLKEGVNFRDFLDDMRVNYKEYIFAAVNIEEILDGGLGIYTNLVAVINIVILIMTLGIVLLVLYLMVKMLLLRKQRDYGILKSVGFTTNQLILQTALSFMPSVIAASIIGTIFSSIIMNPLLTYFFKGIGIMKCTFTIPVVLVIISAAGMIFSAFVFALLLSFKIRKITPYELLING